MKVTLSQFTIISCLTLFASNAEAKWACNYLEQFKSKDLKIQAYIDFYKLQGMGKPSLIKANCIMPSPTPTPSPTPMPDGTAPSVKTEQHVPSNFAPSDKKYSFESTKMVKDGTFSKKPEKTTVDLAIGTSSFCHAMVACDDMVDENSSATKNPPFLAEVTCRATTAGTCPSAEACAGDQGTKYTLKGNIKLIPPKEGVYNEFDRAGEQVNEAEDPLKGL